MAAAAQPGMVCPPPKAPAPRAPSPSPRARGGGARAPKPPPELEREIRLRVAREKLAYETAVALNEPGVRPELLAAARPLLHPSHYDDVLEERSSESLCAYPCCAARLPPFRPRQQLTISRLGSSRRLLQTANAFRFCSAACARLSAEFSRSLPLEPVAQRDTIGPDMQPRRGAGARAPSDERGAGGGGGGGASADAGGAKRAAQADRPLVGDVVERTGPRGGARSAGRAPAQPAVGTGAGAASGAGAGAGGGGGGGGGGGAWAIEGFVPAVSMEVDAAGAKAPRRAAGAKAEAADGGEAEEEEGGGCAPLGALPGLELGLPPGLSPFGLLWTVLSSALTPTTAGSCRWLRRWRARHATARATAAPVGVGVGAGAGGHAAAAGCSAGGGAPGKEAEEELEAMMERALVLSGELRQRAGGAGGAATEDEGAGAETGAGAGAGSQMHDEEEAEEEGEEEEEARSARLSTRERARRLPPGPRSAEILARATRLLRARAERSGAGSGVQAAACAASAPAGAAGRAPPSTERRVRGLLSALDLEGFLESSENGTGLSGPQLDVLAALLLELVGAPVGAKEVGRLLARACLDEHHFAALLAVFSQ